MTKAAPELRFPLDWDGRIVGHDAKEVLDAICGALRKLGHERPVVRGNLSRGGRFVTYNVAITFHDLESMRSVTSAIAQVDGVKFVL